MDQINEDFYFDQTRSLIQEIFQTDDIYTDEEKAKFKQIYNELTKENAKNSYDEVRIRTSILEQIKNTQYTEEEKVKFMEIYNNIDKNSLQKSNDEFGTLLDEIYDKKYKKDERERWIIGLCVMFFGLLIILLNYIVSLYVLYESYPFYNIVGGAIIFAGLITG